MPFAPGASPSLWRREGLESTRLCGARPGTLFPRLGARKMPRPEGALVMGNPRAGALRGCPPLAPGPAVPLPPPTHRCTIQSMKTREPDLRPPAHQTYSEEACRKCGRCCFEKIIVNNEVFCTSVPCAYLDSATRRCSIYPDRFKLNPHCLTVSQGIEFRAFPAYCPYVSGLTDYRPPRPEVVTPLVLDLLETGRVRNLAELIHLARQHPPCDDIIDIEDQKRV